MSNHVAEPSSGWLGGRKFWMVVLAAAFVAAVVVGAKGVGMARQKASPARAALYGPADLTPGGPAVFRVVVQNDDTGKPLAGARVDVALLGPKGERIALANGLLADDRGVASVHEVIPEDATEGSYKVAVTASSSAGRSEVSRDVKMVRSYRVMVTTDKPLYQPGQTIHIRTLTLATGDMKPASESAVVIEVADAKGNMVFKKAGKTSAFGVASADFELADQVNMGDYAITATVGDTSSRKSVNVSRYVLPKFSIRLDTERPYYEPGETVQGDLEARYTFGEPVAGAAVHVEAQEFVEAFHAFVSIDGVTDKEGKFEFEFPLKAFFAGLDLDKGGAPLRIEAKVRDTAGHEQVRASDLTVTEKALRVELFPESGELVQNVENVLYVVAAYPDGRPATARVKLGPPVNREVETTEAGFATVTFTPAGPSIDVSISAEDASGARAEELRTLHIGERGDGVLLRTDRAVYRAGETAKLWILSAASSGRVFLDVVKDRRTELMNSVELKGGRGELSLDLPPDLFGTLQIHAYRLQTQGDIVRDTKVIEVLRSDDLSVTVSADKETYRPAEKALLKIAVSGRDGAPVQAALGLAAVDEAVFALSEMQPGLQAVYFLLQEEILKPRYENHGFAVEPVAALDPKPSPSKQAAQAVLFAAAEGGPGPVVSADQSVGERRALLVETKRSYFRNLARRAIFIPLGLLALLVLPAVGYAVMRLFVRRSLEAGGEQVRALSSVSGSVARRWFAAFYLPPAVVLIAAIVRGGAGGRVPGFVLAVLGIATAGMLLLLALAASRFRRNEASRSVPVLARVVRGLPWAYVAAILAVATLIYGIATELVEIRIVAIGLTAVTVLAALMAASLSIGRHAALHGIGTARWFWLGGSRLVGFLLPVILVFAFGFLTQGRANLAVGKRDAGAVWDGPPPMPGAAILDRMQMGAVGGVANELEAIKSAKPMEKGEAGPKDAAAAPVRVRRLFPETLLWLPEVITDSDGKAEIEVPLADSITTWRMSATAVSAAGALGGTDAPIRVFQDFFVDIDAPVALTQHDEVSLPIAVYNYLDRPQRVRLEAQADEWFSLLDGGSRELTIGPREVKGASFRLRAEKPGRHALTVKAIGSEMSDAIEREIRVVPDGLPVVQTFNGRLGADLKQNFTIPADAIDGATDLFVKIYPGAFSQVMEGLDSIFQMPYGCFEQTSSTTYPNVLVLDYLRRTRQAKPDIEMKAAEFINLGYQRLLSYEVPGGGFEWFGRAPAHNVLTAYGLMEFADMARVVDVDPAVITRTREWLYGEQKGDGTWEPSGGGIAEGAINQYQGATLRTTAYIAWALAETGDKDAKLMKALDLLRSAALDRLRSAAVSGDASSGGAGDPYALALIANALAAADRKDDAAAVLDKLLAAKVEEKETAHWVGGSRGATYSEGTTLDIETTALAAQALLEAGRSTDTAHKALAWLVSKKDPQGTWHSTQATVQAMRALLAGTGAGGSVDGEVKVTVAANGAVARELSITPETSDVFRLVDLKPYVKEGENLVALEAAGKGNLAYQVVATHYVAGTGRSESAGERVLEIDVAYDRSSLSAGDRLKSRVTLRYNGPGAAKMTLVDLGVPPGFEVDADAFEQLRQSGVIQRFTVTGRQIILYFDTLESGVPVEFSYSLKAKYPVRAKAPAAKAYQYYEPDVRDETAPVEITVI